MGEFKECKKCGDEYDPSKKRNGGYIYHCDACSKETTQKYLGRQGLTNKDGSIIVIRENLNYWKRTIARENARGFGANLPLSNAAFEQISEEKRDENEL